MDWYTRFKSFLGFENTHKPQNFDEHDKYWQPEQPPTRNFNVFTEPLEMHRFFEEQMSEMLRNFGFQEFGLNNFPQIEGAPEYPDKDSHLSDQFFKPGYENRRDVELEDKDLDGKLDIKDWGSVFRDGSSSKPESFLTPKFDGFSGPKTHFFGQSVTSKTIRNSDGSMETHHTVRDNQGNEETTITRRNGDKEYSIIKKRDKDGKEEVIENLVNLDEKELDSFFPSHRRDLPPIDQDRSKFYDKFFK